MDKGKLYQLKKAAAGMIFPLRLCVNCESVSLHEILCSDCRYKQRDLRICPRCGSFILKTETEHYLCSGCRQIEHNFVLARAGMPYEGIIRERILNFKYNQQTGWRRHFFALVLDAFGRYYADQGFDAALPVPLSSQRLLGRGYNHTELFTELFCAETDIPHRPGYLQRLKDTRPLAELSLRERREEMKGAFFAEKDCVGQRLLLLDDIYTSGSTADAASSALLKAGASSVHVLCLVAGHGI